MEATKNDKVRKFLGSAMEAKLEIARRRRRVAELESRCQRVTQDPDGRGKSAQNLWAELADEKDGELLSIRDELKQCRDVEDFISSLDNAVDRSILRLRYLEGQNWVQVQQRLYREGIYYSERHITRLHGRALEAARRKMGYTE